MDPVQNKNALSCTLPDNLQVISIHKENLIQNENLTQNVEDHNSELYYFKFTSYWEGNYWSDLR